MSWNRAEFAERIGLGTLHRVAFSGNKRPVVIGKADIDPATRGMIAGLVSTSLDGQGGTEDFGIVYWYRRQNGQSRAIHLLEFKLAFPDDDTVAIEEIYYRNKPLLHKLPAGQREAAEEMLLDAFRETALHLREGGSPREMHKILHERNIEALAGEDIVLPGQNSEGKFHFQLSDTFNPAARGEISVSRSYNLPDIIALGEINTLDAHRRIERGGRSVFASNPANGATFRTDLEIEKRANGIVTRTGIFPARIPEGERARETENLLAMGWRNQQAAMDPRLTLHDMQFMGTELHKNDTDTQIRALGVFYRLMDMVRRRRYPTALDFCHEFGLLDLVSTVNTPPREGRFSVVSYLGNGKEETIEGFGLDLGACKIPMVEWWDQQEKPRREAVCLDVGKLLAPAGSQWDGGLPDIIGMTKDLSAIFLTHRHLDHMAALIELTRLGVLKNVKIYGAPRVLYILENQIKAELDDKTLMPHLNPIEKEGIIHFERLSVEYCVDGMDHSTPSTMYRVLARKNDRKEELAADDVWGSYAFYGDGRRVTKPEFLARGLRGFGIDRQDTLLDVDLTNAKKPGHGPDESVAQKNLLDLMECFPENGVLTGIISTNDRRLKTLYRVYNRLRRNFTAVGHNIEMSLRAHNIHGVDPEYETVFEKENVNRFLGEDAAIETENRTRALKDQLETETDAATRIRLQDQIDELRLLPVEYRSRGSQTAKGWLEGDLGKVAVLVTGTQGNPAEMYSTVSRFAEGWSTLDADRDTAYKIRKASKWLVVIDQSAIPGNDKSQHQLVQKLVRNRQVAGVAVAIDDGIKFYGLAPEKQAEVIARFAAGDRSHYIDNDGTLCVTNAPIHPSGHGYKEDIADIVRTARADWSHGTHTNDPENTRVFHAEICKREKLRHAPRQFDDFEHVAINMNARSEDAVIESLGRQNRSLVLYKIVREFGKFFGGTLQASRVTKLDGRQGFAERGLMAGVRNADFENNVVAVDFATAAANRSDNAVDKTEPAPAVMTPPLEERRSKGVIMPPGVRIDASRRSRIRALMARKAA